MREVEGVLGWEGFRVEVVVVVKGLGFSSFFSVLITRRVFLRLNHHLPRHPQDPVPEQRGKKSNDHEAPVEIVTSCM